MHHLEIQGCVHLSTFQKSIWWTKSRSWFVSLKNSHIQIRLLLSSYHLISFFNLQNIKCYKWTLPCSWLDSFIKGFADFLARLSVTQQQPERSRLEHNYLWHFAFSFHCWGFAVDMENESPAHQGGSKRGMDTSFQKIGCFC